MNELNLMADQPNDSNTVVHLPEGMLGFSRLTRYELVRDESLHPFLWLRCVDDPDLAFPVVDPQLIEKDYLSLIPSKELASLKIRNRSELLVLVVAILRQEPGESSVNLKAPLLINHTKMIGRQIILTESDSNMRAPVATAAALASAG
jgi:flagellar assembly factor FliW